MNVLAALVLRPLSEFRVVVGETPMLLAKTDGRNKKRLTAARKYERKLSSKNEGRLTGKRAIPGRAPRESKWSLAAGETAKIRGEALDRLN